MAKFRVNWFVMPFISEVLMEIIEKERFDKIVEENISLRRRLDAENRKITAKNKQMRELVTPPAKNNFAIVEGKKYEIKDVLKLPTRAIVNKNLRGVYFLFKGNNLRYIGQSENLISRIYTHVSKCRDFDNYAYIEVSAYALKYIEAAFISAFDPPHNVEVNNEAVNWGA